MPGIDINKACEEGQMLLHEAVKYGHVRLVQLLIEKGADVNLINQYKHSPHLSQYRNYLLILLSFN